MVTKTRKRKCPSNKRPKRTPMPKVVDSSSLTDLDWTTINSLQRSYERGGAKALSAALKKLAADPIRYVRVVGAFFPEMIREMIRDMLAAKGTTREDLEEIIQEHEKPARLQ
jgi:hypothetical protein